MPLEQSTASGNPRPDPDRAEQDVRFHLGHAYFGLRAGAAWTHGVRRHHARFPRRIAIVSELRWVRRGSRLLASVLPCPLRVFDDRQWSTALEWLRTPNRSCLSTRMLGDSGICLVEASAPLSAEDIEAIADALAPWISSRGAVEGLVFHLRDGRAWHNLGALVQHARFAHEHRGRIRNVSIATDSHRLGLVWQTMGDLMKAVVCTFGHAELAEAIAWTSRSVTGRA